MKQQEYRDAVETAAEIAVEEADNAIDDPWELAWHEADNHHWIIGTSDTSAHLGILRHGEFDPDEWTHMVDDSMSWQEVIQTLAFLVFRGDIAREIEDRIDNGD